MSLIVRIQRIEKDLPVPSYAYEGDAAFDLYAAEEIVLAHGARAGVRTGIKLEIPMGYVGLVWDKGSIGVKAGLKSLGGVVDCGYRGEVIAGIVNLSGEDYRIERGQKIAQMIIQKTENVQLEEVEELGVSERGERGFGSSGK